MIQYQEVSDSKLHWTNKCPHNSNQHVNLLEERDHELAENESEEDNIVLMIEELTKLEIFAAEA